MKAALHETGLPLPVAYETQAASAVHTALKTILDEKGAFQTTVSDTADMLSNLWDRWADDGYAKPSPMLVKAVDAALASNPETSGLAGCYFELVTKLHEEYAMPYAQAMGLLADITLIKLFSTQGDMCAGRISEILGGNISYNAINDLLNATSSPKAQLSIEDVDNMIADDREVERRVFKDDTLDATFDTMKDVFSRLGDDGTISECMRILKNADFLPYMGVLHYEMLSVGKYDRKPGTALYEFSPRGAVSNHIWAKYQKYDHTQNPYLNNFKAIRDIDRNWLENRFNKKANVLTQRCLSFALLSNSPTCHIPPDGTPPASFEAGSCVSWIQKKH